MLLGRNALRHWQPGSTLARESPGAASKTHRILDPIPWFLFNLKEEIPERAEKWIFLIQMTREWQVRAVFSSAQNFLVRLKWGNTSQSGNRDTAHTQSFFEWIGDGYLQWNVVRLIKMALPVYKMEMIRKEKWEIQLIHFSEFSWEKLNFNKLLCFQNICLILFSYDSHNSFDN